MYVYVCVYLHMLICMGLMMLKVMDWQGREVGCAFD